ncbi:uncharacterized protein TNCV_5037941 [Trichonephila clavipes]|nr:uncharacterized protein TNCV_5037941 [Trichonephila clavipes]
MPLVHIDGSSTVNHYVTKVGETIVLSLMQGAPNKLKDVARCEGPTFIKASRREKRKNSTILWNVMPTGTTSSDAKDPKSLFSTYKEDFDSDDTDRDPDYNTDINNSSLSEVTPDDSGRSPLPEGKREVIFSSDKQNSNRKRKIRVQKWQRSERKGQRNSGKAYNYIKRIEDNDGKIIDRIVLWKEERKLLPPCGDKCRLTCRNKFTEEQRKYIFNEYWKMGDLQRQRDFIAINTAKINPKYRYQ